MPLITAHEDIENRNWSEFKEQIHTNICNGIATSAYVVTTDFEIAEVSNVRFVNTTDRYLLFDTNDYKKQVEHCCVFFPTKEDAIAQALMQLENEKEDLRNAIKFFDEGIAKIIEQRDCK